MKADLVHELCIEFNNIIWSVSIAEVGQHVEGRFLLLT